jgi:hypothetical protein
VVLNSIHISPVTTGSSNNIVSYGATGGFIDSIISYSNLKEIDFYKWTI